jgi:hypothetical protein
MTNFRMSAVGFGLLISKIFLLTSLVSCVNLRCTSKPESSLTLEVLKNATFRSEWLRGGVAQLVEGVYKEKYGENSAAELTLYLTNIHAFGDLNKDGSKDAVAVLIVDPGGSGTFYYLAAILDQNGTPNNVALEFLGDRVKIKTVSIRSSIVFVDMITHGLDDGLCCPTQPVLRRYKLEGNTLVHLSDGD